MKRSWIACAALSGALAWLSATVLLAKPGIVKTRDGRTLEGDVTEKADGVVVTVRGIPTTISRDDLDSIQYIGSIDQQYQDRLAKLPKNPTAADHLELARWLFGNRAYDLARKEVAEAQRLDPNNTDAATLSQTIQSQMRLEHTKPGVTGGPATRPADAHPPKNTTTQAFTASLHKYLSGEQINLLKQAEWPKDDNTVKVAFNGDVKRRYIAAADPPEDPAAFNALSAQEQAFRIVSQGRPDERKDVRIANDPAPLAQYKRAIQPFILSGCATAGCHGGPNGGKFFLYGTPDSDAATYTNFYLLTRAAAQVDAAEHMMIDRQYNDKSLLVEFGLPPLVSGVAHPEVKGVTLRALFRSRDDPQYKALMRWMGKLVTPEPRYDFKFSLEGEAGKPDKPATQPAAAPAPPVRPAQ